MRPGDPAGPFAVLAARIARKSDLHLIRAEVTGEPGAGQATVSIRGADTTIPVLGAAPSTGDVIWVLSEGNTKLGLTV